ncbi:glycosyltransferase family 2 protein [Microbacterium sp. CFH 31415]|uniref:glycosyltransferase family 2 protein n=1 Tax=Microbacterium sp. CFH 31415 TaxID=2921732 RepID=UPI001F1334A6|nr:glycosyltransferase family 2 protein [Microbacterium sp. CFH 31415]MCH6230744.1 glycosyltransferase family 2 protein [Microbacterium sp. CFH 31415]
MTTPDPPAPTVSVIIITYARPQYIAECLRHLYEMTRRPHQIIVVDGSPDDRTRDLVSAEHPDVVYIRHQLGKGTMPESRQLGLAAATGDIVAFIDDDAYADREWLTELTRVYDDDPTVAGVGGRADNGIPGEDREGVGTIGRLLPNGDLTGYFGANSLRPVDVDHFLGANQSYRRSILESIGGIRGNYPGTCLREESDTCLRLTAAGYRLVFAPRALVRHVAAPYQIGGQRFDRRYLYYSRRNHVMLLARVFGWRTPYLRRYYVTAFRQQGHYFSLVGRLIAKGRDAEGEKATMQRRVTSPIILTRSVVEIAGLFAGVWAGIDGRRRDRRAGVGTP